MKPRIFISTVSSELKTVRQLTANVLQGLGYDPVWQDIFGTEPGDLKQVLRQKIDDCEGLIQIVGRGYGAEPPQPDPDFGRVSYTQYEFLYARSRGKKTWILFAEDGCSRDLPLDRLDLPVDPDHPEPAAYRAERQALQESWRQRLRQDGHLRHGASNDIELELKLERLKNEFADLRRGFRRWQKIVSGVGIAALILMGCLLLMQWRTKRSTDEGMKNLGDQVKLVREGQTISPTRIRQHLVEASEKAREEALAAANKQPEFDMREKLRQQAEKAHETRLGRIDDLVAGFVALERQADTSPILLEMSRILSEEKVNPVDKAIAYAEGKRPTLLAQVRARKQAEHERDRLAMEPLLTAASLEQSRGRSEAARARFQELLDLEPDWPQALESYAYFLCDQSVQSREHGSLQTALADAEHCDRLATKLHAQAQSNPEGQRVLSVACEVLGSVLVIRGQAGDAERALNSYERGLELSEGLLKRNPDSAEAARDVSVSLNKLGGFLAHRGQAGDAERALNSYERGLELSEGLLKRNPDSAEAARDVSVSLNKLGDFFAHRGQPGDAERALKSYERGLELREGLLKRNRDSAEAAHDVMSSLDNLGDFLAHRGQAGDAERALKYCQRDLELSERLLKRNRDSTQAARDVSLSLERLGDFLAHRGQAGDAERALKYYERGLQLLDGLLKRNPDSALAARDVSVSLDNVGDFLAHRGQPGDAERALKSYERGLELREGLLRRNSDSALAARDVSLSLERLGDVAQHGQPGDAERALKSYERGLELREGLLRRNPDSALAARDVMLSHCRLGDLRVKLRQFESARAHFGAGIALLDAMIASGQNAEQSTRDKAMLLPRLQFCMATIVTGDWDGLLKVDAAVLPTLLSLRATVMARQGKLADVAQAGTRLRGLKPATIDSLYNAACAYGLCMGLVVRDTTKPNEVECRKYRDLAIDCLKEAIAAGFKNFDHMRKDGDLKPLHGLPEFESLFPKAAPK